MSKKPMVTKSHLVAKFSDFFSLLNERQQNEFVDEVIVEQYKGNDCVYEEGDVPNYLFFLYSGKAKISKKGIANKTQILRLVNSGDFFGYRDYFANKNYVTSCVVFENSIVCKVNFTTIDKLINEEPHIGLYFSNKMAQAIGHLEERVTGLTQKHVRGRLAEALILLKETYGVKANGYTLDISPSRDDLAKISNMTTANAIRTLRAFSNEGLISLDGRKITLINEDEIRSISRKG